MHKFSGKTAFTLAETLIAMTIIGVVAAITIPSMNTAFQKKETTERLKQTFSLFAQSANISVYKYGDMSSWDYSLSNNDFFYEYLDNFVKAKEMNINETEVQYKQSNGQRETGLLVMRSSAKVKVLNSGAMIFTDGTVAGSADKPRKCYAVDINGTRKPNKFGRDLFMLCIDGKRGKVTPHYWNDNEDSDAFKTREELKNGKGSYNYHCNRTTGRGMWCAALIMRDNWEIKDDYPW